MNYDIIFHMRKISHNEVPWDAWGNLCSTSESKRLNDLIRIHIEMQEKKSIIKNNASKNGSIYITGRK